MPPSSEHLQWTKIDKFGGLWTAGDKLLMPANAAQVMSACHPQPQGGLRAFYAPHRAPTDTLAPVTDFDDITMKGLSDYGEAVVTAAWPPLPDGSYAWVCQTFPTLDLNDNDATEPTFPRSTFAINFASSPRFWWWDTLTARWTYAAPASAPTYQFGNLPYRALLPSSSSALGGYSMGYANVGGDLFEINLGLGARMNMGAGALGRVRGQAVIHQSRVVVGLGPSVVFSAPGSITALNTGATPTNFVYLEGEDIAWILPIPPADLLVGTTSGAIFNIQGDLDDPVVRTLVNTRTDRQLSHVPVLTPFGAVVILPTGPTIVGPDGSQSPIGAPLSNRLWNGSLAAYAMAGGSLAYQSGLLFVPNWHGWDRSDVGVELVDDDLTKANGALVYDFASGAWFTSTHPDVRSVRNPVHCLSEYGGKVRLLATERVAPAGAPDMPFGAVYYMNDEARSPVYEWVSAPLHADDGREVALQEVRFAALGHADTAVGNTVTLTARNEHGEEVSVALDIDAGRGVYTTALRIKGTMVDLRIKSVSHDDLEAPMIEYVAMGWTPEHIRRQRQTGGYPTAYAGGY